MSPAVQGIKSSSPKQCRKCVQAVTKCLTERDVFERALKLQTATDEHGLTPPLAKGWERIDRDLLRARLQAEPLTKHGDRPAWSPKLHHASLIAVRWKITLSSIRTNREASQQLERTRSSNSTGTNHIMPQQKKVCHRNCAMPRPTSRTLEKKRRNTDPNSHKKEQQPKPSQATKKSPKFFNELKRQKPPRHHAANCCESISSHPSRQR